MIGKRLKHYEVEESLGEGGMGVVYRARDLRLERPVALKVLKPELTGNPDRQRRFLREARAASAVTHPAIAQIYDVDEAEGVTFIAMELVDGKTVRQMIESRELDLQTAIGVTLQVAEGLARAHEAGIIHRDIKSDNIMVTRDGHAKILDFGLAKLLDTNTEDGEEHTSAMETLAKTRAGMVMGTIAYMSPEQARGQPVDPRSDLFSLGIVFYEMVAGELPFQGASALDTMHAIAYEEVRPVTVVRKNLPVDVHRIISRCLRKRPEDRYPTTTALAADLKVLQRDIESGVQRSPAPVEHRIQELVERLKRSLPGWAPAMVVVVGLALVAFMIVSDDAFGMVLSFGIIGLVCYRFARNRRRRLTKRLVNRIAKIEEVKAIRSRPDGITVFADAAPARLYVRVNSLVDAINHKHFFGEDIEAKIQDDLSPEEFHQALRQPGIAYVRKDVLES